MDDDDDVLMPSRSGLEKVSKKKKNFRYLGWNVDNLPWI